MPFRGTFEALFEGDISKNDKFDSLNMTVTASHFSLSGEKSQLQP
jgi:hypothetical protein